MNISPKLRDARVRGPRKISILSLPIVWERARITAKEKTRRLVLKRNVPAAETAAEMEPPAVCILPTNAEAARNILIALLVWI